MPATVYSRYPKGGILTSKIKQVNAGNLGVGFILWC